MAVIKITNLGGIEPSILPRNLPTNGAQVALNLNPGTPEFRPLLSDVAVAAAQHVNALTLYRFDRNPDGSLNTNESAGWTTAPSLRNIVRQQIDDDVSGKIYYTPADGSAPMRWHNAAGAERQVGVPRPTAAPTIVSVNDSYVFTADVRDAEMGKARADAVQMVLDRVTQSWAGPDLPLPTGWVRTSDVIPVSDPRFENSRREVIRVFALDPATKAIINTFSAMPIDEASWVFDRTLGGSYYTRQSGDALPAWAIGFTEFWIIGMQAFAQVYDIDEAGIKTAVLTLKKPGTQGAEPLLTDAQADVIVARLADHGDKDNPAVKVKIDALRAKIFDVGERFAAGGSSSLAAQTTAFYAKADVQAQLASAREDFAQTIWGYVNMIGSATAAPFWQDDNFA